MEWKLEVVIVPVTDVDAAKKFYGEQVGFTVDLDHQISETYRIVQLTPPGSGCSIVFGQGLSEMTPGSLKGVQLVVSDVAAAREQLVSRGVDVSPVQHFEKGVLTDGPGEAWNSFIFFSDPDGNAWTVQERPASA